MGQHFGMAFSVLENRVHCINMTYEFGWMGRRLVRNFGHIECHCKEWMLWKHLNKYAPFAVVLSICWKLLTHSKVHQLYEMKRNKPKERALSICVNVLFPVFCFLFHFGERIVCCFESHTTLLHHFALPFNALSFLFVCKWSGCKN